MPIYEYQCRDCSHHFERLVRSQDATVVSCPSCQSANLERLLSAFAVDSESGRQRNLAVGRALAKKGNRDKEIAEAEHVKEHIMGHDH